MATGSRITNRSLKELPFDIEQQKEMKKLSDMDEDSLDGFRDYVIQVIKGTKKQDALKDALPHRWDRANAEYETGENGTFNRCITKEINKVERIQVVKDMYVAQHKEWWKSFLLMKNQLFGNLYDIAMDDLPDRDGKPRRVIPRDRIAASKTLLEHMPELKEETVIHHKVEQVDVEEQFKNRLEMMQAKLREQSKAEAIPVEIVEAKKPQEDVIEIVEDTKVKDDPYEF